MTDLINLARERVATTDQCKRCEGCERDHCECLIQRMADEIELLSNELKAEQTLNRITCEMDEACCQCRGLRDEIARLRAQVESLSEQLTMESIDTTCHCAAKSAAECGCPGAVWPEDVLRAEVARLREALRTARDGLAHIKAVAGLHTEGADAALEEQP